MERKGGRKGGREGGREGGRREGKRVEGEMERKEKVRRFTNITYMIETTKYFSAKFSSFLPRLV